MADKSTKPSGLKISRNGNKFTCEWSIPSAKYGDGQQFKATTVSKEEISKTATKKVVTIDLSQRYPASGGKKLTSFHFLVRGKTSKRTYSDWSEKEHVINVPSKPSVTAELTATNQSKFSWTVANTDKTTWRPFYRVSVYTALVEDMTYEASAIKSGDWTLITNQSTIGGATITKSGYKSSVTGFAESGYVTITESSSVISGGNFTRAVKIVAQGCAGDSVAYSTHVYGASNQAEMKDSSVSETSGGYDIRLDWNTDYDASTPIDETTIQYTIATPENDMSCPAGASWTDARTIQDTAGGESVHIQIDTRLSTDQCLYTRINTKHDSNVTYGAAELQMIGKLKSPTGLTVSTSQSTSTATITATNASSVDDTVLEVIYRKNGSDAILGLITGSPNYVTVVCPAWGSTDLVQFGVRAVLPKSSDSYTDSDTNVTYYTIEPYMESETVWQSGTAAVAPSNISLTKADDDVLVSWQNNWPDANQIELSWSQNQYAWESTDDPDTYEIANPYITSWRISGLASGTTWFVKVRSVYDSGDGTVYSPYSATAQINLSSAPSIPTLSVSKGIVAEGEGFTAAWEYASTDGTPQSEARLYEYANSTYTEIAYTQTQEYVDVPGWSTNGTYQICVEVTSESGLTTRSGLVSITVAEPLSCSMTTSLVEETVTDDTETRTINALKALPLTVTVTGAGSNNTTSVIIKRAESYHLERPDESELDGYEGEIVYNVSQTGNGAVSVEIGDLIGSLDDGGKYTLIAVVYDDIGQTAKDSIDFEVDWTAKAYDPLGDMLMSTGDRIATITPILPSGGLATDTADIYRLSADKPVLIYKDATFGSKYVDPYPAIGVHGGYRIVYRTAEQSYRTDDGTLAFTDLYTDILDSKAIIIDFGTDSVELNYNIDLSGTWAKQFTQKNFLDGTVKGYWQEGVTRSGNASAVGIPSYETELIEGMRRLSEYTGPCHVRTPEGSSFTADVQCQESWTHDTGDKIVSFSLTITRTDNSIDGMTYSEWIGEE